MTPKQADRLIGKIAAITDAAGSSARMVITKRDRWHIYGRVAGQDHEAKIDRSDILSFTICD